MGRVSAASLVKGETGIELHGKRLRIHFTYKGVRCREPVNLPVTKANVKYAVGLRATVLHEIETGVFDYRARFPDSPNAAKFGRSNTLKHINLKTLYDKYIKIKAADLGPQTLRRYKVGLGQCLAHIGEACLVSSLLPENIAEMRADLIATRTPSTVNHYMAAFKGLLEFAHDNGYTEFPLANGCKKFKVGKTDPFPLTLDEYQRIIDNGCLHPTHKHLVTVAVYTGLRTGELRALAWEDIDFENRTLLVRRNIAKDEQGEFFKPPKTDEARTIQLMPPAYQALLDQRAFTLAFPATRISVRLDQKKITEEDVRPVFRPTSALPHHENHLARDNQWYAETSLTTQWATFLKRAKVPHRRIYQTRHTYACWQLTAHGNIAFIAEQLGHNDYSMLVKTYGRWMKTESQQEAVRVWEALELKGHIVPRASQTIVPPTQVIELDDKYRPIQTHPDDAAVPAHQTATS